MHTCASGRSRQVLLAAGRIFRAWMRAGDGRRRGGLRRGGCAAGRGTAPRSDAGLTLLELLAAIAIAAMVTVACGYLGTAVVDLCRFTGAAASQLSDTSFVYWELQRLAQNARQAGTQLVSSGSGQFVDGKSVTGTFPVLALKVSNLDGIAPENTAVYQAVQGGDYVCVAVVPLGGRGVLALFPGGEPYDPSHSVYPPAQDIYPIPDVATDFADTEFQILSQYRFTVVLTRRVQRAGAYAVPGALQDSLKTMTFSFQIGPQLF